MKPYIFILAMLASSTILAQQFLPVKSIVNARDLGGYTMQDGRRIRNGVLFRAAHLAEVSDSDIKYLSSVPTATVIDFRKEVEKMGMEDKMIPGAKYIVLPIDASGNAEAEATEKEKRKISGQKKFNVKKIILFAAFNDKAKRVAQEMYPTLLFDPECQQQFAHFFRLVLATDSGAVLYHCTQGKDRTGIASALLLAALGADRQTIVEDFDATNKVYEKDIKRYSRLVRLCGGKDEEVGVVKSFLGCNTENLIKALERIDREYGSIEAYLKCPMGLTDQDIHTLRERYLE